MKAIFINENHFPFAHKIADGSKPVETRNKNMLSALVGERVALVRTKNGKKPAIVGYATIYRATQHEKKVMDSDFMRKLTLIETGSKYDSTEKGKWCYWMKEAETCEEFLLPSSAIRHGRSWCEF